MAVRAVPANDSGAGVGRAFETASVQATRQLGARLARRLQAGDLLALVGELGSGKTSFTQGIARGLGVTGSVTSPTFTLVNEYRGRLPLYHIDLYRLDSFPDLAGIGLDEYLEGDGVTVIEWPERAQPWLPEDYLRVRFQRTGDHLRRLSFEPLGERYRALVQAL